MEEPTEHDQEVQEPEQAAPTESEQKTEDKPTGWKTVDFNELPDDIRQPFEDRFNRIYGQLKRSQNVISQMSADQKGLMDKLNSIEHSQSQNIATEAVSRVRGELKGAMDSGDSDLTATKVAELARLEGQRSAPRTEQIVSTPTPQDEGPLSPAEVAAVNGWSVDKKYMINPESEDYRWGLAQLNDIWVSNPDLATDDKLRLMNTRAAQKFNGSTNSAVLGTGAPAPAKPKGIKLDRNQEAVARALFPGMKSEEAYKKYSSGMRLTGVN